MPEKRILDLFDIKSRFLRSVQLERDFRDPAALVGYVRTDFVQESCDRIAEGLRPESGRRAWRITGDYGSGKSSFALLLANALGRREAEVPPQVRKVIDFRKLGLARLRQGAEESDIADYLKDLFSSHYAEFLLGFGTEDLMASLDI
jgi:hypothetical protein